MVSIFSFTSITGTLHLSFLLPKTLSPFCKWLPPSLQGALGNLILSMSLSLVSQPTPAYPILLLHFVFLHCRFQALIHLYTFNTASYCHPAYLTYMQSTSCKMLGWMKHTPTEPRDSCPLIRLILASGAARHLLVHLPDTRQMSRAQSCPTLWDPTDGSPPGSPIPGILQARTLEWVAISFSNKRNEILPFAT